MANLVNSCKCLQEIVADRNLNFRLGPGTMGGSSRQDSIRSGYVSDHETLAGPNAAAAAGGGGGGGRGGHRSSLGGAGQPLPVTVIQASQQQQQSGSMDARMCYLTSSEVSEIYGRA